MTPRELSIETIKKAVEELRLLVSSVSTEAIAGACFVHELKRANQAEESQTLHSPAKQWSFLLGLLLETPEPRVAKDFCAGDLERAKELLNTAFSAYELLYYPSPEEQANLNDKWWQARAVAMPAFLHFVGTGFLASDDQIVARIRKYVVPFDAAVADQLGVSGSSALAICQWIGQRLQQALDDATHAVKAESEARAILLAEAAQQRWGLQEVRAAATRPAYSAKLRTLLKEISSAGKVSLDDLREAFPSTAEIFWQRFSVGRGEGPHIEYPTERSISNERPLIRLSQGEAVCPSFGELLLAVLEVSERCLGEGSHRASFFRARDKTLEDEARKPLAGR